MTKKKTGFTLIETLLAVSVLSMALMLLANSWAGSFNKIKRSQLSFEVAALLERKMGELDRTYRGKSIDEIPEDDQTGDFGEEYPQYTWKYSSRKLEMPDLGSLLMGQEGGADQTLLSLVKQLSDNMSKMIKELTLTITYKEGKRTLSFSVTSYFVDYDKTPSFGAP